MYSRCEGQEVTAADVLDDQEYAAYLNRRADDAHYRLSHFARTGRMPRAVGENTEEAAVTAYERQVYGS